MARKRIDLLLVERGLFESRAKARAAIEAGNVAADGAIVAKPSELIDEAAEITAEPAHGWVGRGALKLAHALTVWPISAVGKIVLDVGASTGGFTEVCLKAGAGRVYAVDVGHGQLHPRLSTDARVVDLQGIDARALTSTLIDAAPELIVCDASFIGLDKVLPAALALAAPGADLVCLVKPQFQLGPGRVGKGGVVKAEADRLEALEGAKDFLAASGWEVRAVTESPISGAGGNMEYLLWGRQSGLP